MILSIDEFEPFIPKWNDNETEENPIKIFYRNPTMPLYEKLIPKPELVIKIGADGAGGGGESHMVLDNTKIVKEMVTKIENFSIPVGPDKTPLAITKAEQLFGENIPSKVSGLIDEIGAYLQGILSKKGNVEAKN